MADPGSKCYNERPDPIGSSLLVQRPRFFFEFPLLVVTFGCTYFTSHTSPILSSDPERLRREHAGEQMEGGGIGEGRLPEVPRFQPVFQARSRSLSSLIKCRREVPPRS